MGHESLLDKNPDYWTQFSKCLCTSFFSFYMQQHVLVTICLCKRVFYISVMLLLVDNTTKAVFLTTVRTIACPTSGYHKKQNKNKKTDFGQK